MTSACCFPVPGTQFNPKATYCQEALEGLRPIVLPIFGFEGYPITFQGYIVPDFYSLGRFSARDLQGSKPEASDDFQLVSSNPDVYLLKALL